MKTKIELALTLKQVEILERAVKNERKELKLDYDGSGDGQVYLELMESESLLGKIRRQIKLFKQK